MSETAFAGIAPELGDAGPCPTVALGDKTWTVGWPTQRAKGQLEFLVVEAARANIERLRGVLTPVEFQREEAGLSGAIRGGHWKTWGSLWSEVTNGPDTNTLFLTSLLRERHPEARVADAERLLHDAYPQTADALALVVPPFYALLVESLPGTPEQRAAIIKTSASEFLAMMTRLSRAAATDSSAATTS